MKTASSRVVLPGIDKYVNVLNGVLISLRFGKCSLEYEIGGLVLPLPSHFDQSHKLDQIIGVL